MADIYVAGSGQVASVLIASEESAEEAAASEAAASASAVAAAGSAQEAEDFSAAARNRFWVSISPATGAFQLTSTPTAFGPDIWWGFDMPADTLVATCKDAPVGAAWTMELYYKRAGGAWTLFGTVSVSTGANVSPVVTLAPAVQLLRADLVNGKCTSVGTASTGAYGRIEIVGEALPA